MHEVLNASPPHFLGHAKQISDTFGDEYSSQIAVTDNGLLFISGVLPFTDNADHCVSACLRNQLEQTFENLRSILTASDSDLEHLISIQILIPDKESLTAVNEVFRRKFTKHKPARNIIPCGSTHPVALVEMSAVAMVSSERIATRWHKQLVQSHGVSALN